MAFFVMESIVRFKGNIFVEQCNIIFLQNILVWGRKSLGNADVGDSSNKSKYKYVIFYF